MAIRKHPNVMTSKKNQILSSHAANAARGIGVASKRSNGIRV